MGFGTQHFRNSSAAVDLAVNPFLGQILAPTGRSWSLPVATGRGSSGPGQILDKYGDTSWSESLTTTLFAASGAAAKRPRRRGKLRIVIYSRYSTDEQDASSIPDQIR